MGRAKGNAEVGCLLKCVSHGGENVAIGGRYWLLGGERGYCRGENVAIGGERGYWRAGGERGYWHAGQGYIIMMVALRHRGPRDPD